MLNKNDKIMATVLLIVVIIGMGVPLFNYFIKTDTKLITVKGCSNISKYQCSQCANPGHCFCTEQIVSTSMECVFSMVCENNKWMRSRGGSCSSEICRMNVTKEDVLLGLEVNCVDEYVDFSTILDDKDLLEDETPEEIAKNN